MHVRLRDGRLVRLRRIRPHDKAMLAEGLRLASPASVHLRFLGPKPGFTSRELRYLTEVDFHLHYAPRGAGRGRPGPAAGRRPLDPQRR